MNERAEPIERQVDVDLFVVEGGHYPSLERQEEELEAIGFFDNQPDYTEQEIFQSSPGGAVRTRVEKPQVGLVRGVR